MRMVKPASWFSASKGTEVGYESEKWHAGVFTHYLLQAVANPITYEAARDEILKRMIADNASGQSPELLSDLDSMRMRIPFPAHTVIP